jgi:hypothetical protein
MCPHSQASAHPPLGHLELDLSGRIRVERLGLRVRTTCPSSEVGIVIDVEVELEVGV